MHTLQTVGAYNVVRLHTSNQRNSEEVSKKMAKDPDYYSVNESSKPADKQVYHDNLQCRAGRDIPQNERRSGTGGYRHCKDCDA